jgi:hypothetical protein
MMLNATFNNISAISWWSVLLVEETGKKNTDLPHFTDKLIIIKAVNKPQCYLGHGPNKALLVPDSLRGKERIGNRINACATTGTIENG